MPASNDIVIDTFRPADQEAFAELNRAWLTEYGLLEAPDERQLVNPVQEIIGPAARSFWPGATARWSEPAPSYRMRRTYWSSSSSR